jgi:hypothetical protein
MDDVLSLALARSEYVAEAPAVAPH